MVGAALGRRDASHAAIDALAADFAPLNDLRASAAYRAKVAGNLLRRFWLETRAERPLAAERAAIWPAAAAWTVAVR